MKIGVRLHRNMTNVDIGRATFPFGSFEQFLYDNLESPDVWEAVRIAILNKKVDKDRAVPAYIGGGAAPLVRFVCKD